MSGRIALALASLLLLSPIAALAADQPPNPANRGPKAEEFYRVQAEMNTLLAELATLQTKYRTANEEKRAEIQQVWKELIPKGEKIEPKFVESALEAYTEAPNADRPLAELLVRLLAQKIERDEYEAAAPIGNALMENKCPVRELPNWAGIAAFAVSDFDAAAKYLSQAEQEGFYKSPPKNDKLAPVGASLLENMERYKKAWAAEKDIRDREAKEDDLPRVLLKIADYQGRPKGEIELELFENEAPNTVKNFVSLVGKRFYDGLTFHRVLAGFMAQGGDPLGDGRGGPDYYIACECYQPNHRLHFRGSLSMAHAGQDTGGSQFFLTFLPTPQLDGKHTVFGRVIGGMDVLAKLQRRDPSDKEAARPDKIVEATVIRKRPHAYVPQKLPM